MEQLKLLTWMATNRDPRFLENVIYALEKSSGKKVGTVYYLHGGSASDQIKSEPILQAVKDFCKNKVQLELIFVGTIDVNDHSQVLNGMIHALEPRLHEMGDICVNITSGTPTMSTIWMVLKAMDFFNGRATYYSAQKYKPSIHRTNDVEPKEKQKIEKIDFEIKNSYLRMVQKIRKENPAEAILGINSKVPARQKAFEQITRFAAVDGVPMFLMGERGVGKSSTVRQLISKFKNKKLVEVVCGSFESNLADSMLFGHKKGSFTGAINDRKGFIEQANGGILFLDEIQDLPKSAQRKLLQVIQDSNHAYTPVGSDEPKTADLQFIFASNHPLEKLRQELCPDFFDRISFFTVEIPSLKDCKQDINDDWQAIWNSCRPKNDKKKGNPNIPETAPWNDTLQEFFAKDVNLQGNIRSLQKVAYQLIAWEAWDDETRQKETLAELEANNKEKYRIDHPEESQPSAQPGDQGNSPFAIEKFPEFQEQSWKACEKSFKKTLAQWAYKKYGTYEKAATALRCTKETLMSFSKKDS